MDSLITILAAFGLTYVIIDSDIAKPVREKLWPKAHCYFCVGFWAGALLELAQTVVFQLSYPYELHQPAAVSFLEVNLIGLASCGVSGWLEMHMVVYEQPAEEREDE